MSDDAMLEAVALQLNIEIGRESASRFYTGFYAVKPLTMAFIESARTAGFAIVPQAQADRYAKIVREKRIADRAYEQGFLDAQCEAEDRMDDLLREAAKDAAQ